MKIEEFRSWIKKRYGNFIRIVSDGTDKASDEGHVYLIQWLVVAIVGTKLYYNSTVKVKSKSKKQYLHSSRFMMELRNDGWYLINHEEAKKYVRFFVKTVLEDMLK